MFPFSSVADPDDFWPDLIQIVLFYSQFLVSYSEFVGSIFKNVNFQKISSLLDLFLCLYCSIV